MKIMLEGLHIKHYIQDRLLLNINRLKIYQNDRIGLVGKMEVEKQRYFTYYIKIVPEEGIVKQFSHCELIPQLKLIESTKSGGELTRSYIRQVLDKIQNCY